MSLISDNKNTALSVLGAVSALSAAYSIYRSFSTDKTKLEIPTPNSCYPYVGHLLSLGDLPGKKIAEWHTKYGPIINVRMGVQNWICIGDPTLAHELFVTNYNIESAGRHYATYSSKYYSFGKKGIVFADADAGWKKARSVVLNVLAPKAVEKYLDLIEHGSSDLVDRLIQATKADGSVNPSKNLELYSLSIISKVTLGKKFESVEDPDFKKISYIVEEGIKMAGPDYDMPNFLPIFGPVNYYFGVEKKMRDFVKNERDVYFRKYIEESRKNKVENMITALLYDDEIFDEEEVLVIISDMLAAGSETVSTTLSWAMCILCNYPDVQKKMQDELDAFVQKNGSLPKFVDRPDIPYCASVIRECMRYKSTTPFGIPHRATKELNIRGYTIPKDSILISSMDAMHVGAGYYADQEAFVPDRFLHDPKTMTAASNGKFSERDHFNFGWGRRLCPGIYLAEVEIFNAFVSIFAKTTVEPIYENGKASFPNYSGAKAGGVTTLPLPFSVRFVERL
ncbi:cytochrome P450 [Backusella circina FSU 941]|nr:cytochrome P450 [Backusella circina FSU 941]